MADLIGGPDAARLATLVLYWHGGLYLDMKSDLLRVPHFAENPTGIPWLYTSGWDVTRVGVYHGHLFPKGELQQFWIAAEPGNLALWSAVRRVVANIAALTRLRKDEAAPFLFLPVVDGTKSRILSTTGPIAFTYAVAQAEIETPGCLLVLDPNGNGVINYHPPDKRECTNRRADHYTRGLKPLVKRPI